MIPLKSYREYVDSIDKVAEGLCQYVRRIWGLFDKTDGASVRDMLMGVLPLIVESYCDMASEAAAQYYERERKRAWGGSFRASLADGPPSGQVEKNIRFCMGYFFEGRPEKTIDELCRTFDMHVRNAARATMILNMEVDNGEA